MILETVITTVAADGQVHMAPLGLIAADADDRWIIAPTAPSITLDNLRAIPQAVANHVTDVRIVAGCMTGRRHWPVLACSHVLPPRLAAALTHEEMVVERTDTSGYAPRFTCRVVHRATHAPFEGFNRAQAAVIEASILVGRLSVLPRARVEREMDIFRSAVDSTAGQAEQTAWDWLDQAVAAFYSAQATRAQAAAHAAAPAGVAVAVSPVGVSPGPVDR